MIVFLCVIFGWWLCGLAGVMLPCWLDGNVRVKDVGTLLAISLAGPITLVICVVQFWGEMVKKHGHKIIWERKHNK